MSTHQIPIEIDWESTYINGSVRCHIVGTSYFFGLSENELSHAGITKPAPPIKVGDIVRHTSGQLLEVKESRNVRPRLPKETSFGDFEIRVDRSFGEFGEFGEFAWHSATDFTYVATPAGVTA